MTVLGVLAYANAARGPFVFDDYQWIPENPDIRYLSRFLPGGPGYEASRTRAFTHFTFALDYRLFGLQPWAFKATNVAIHLASALLVYALVNVALRAPPLTRSALARAPRAVAFFAAVLFVAHPLQTQAVTYVVQRATSLATCLYLLAIVLYARWRLGGHAAARSRWARAAHYAAIILVAVLASRSKEIAFTLPLSIAAFEFCLLDATARRRVLYLAPILATMASVPLALLSGSESAGSLVSRVASVDVTTPGASWGVYVVTQPAVIARYLGLLVFPVGRQSIDHDKVLYSSIAEPEVLTGVAILLVLAGAAAWILARTSRNPESGIDPGARLVAFGIIWFFLGLSVESLVALDDTMVEHRMYLPSVGLFVAAAAGIALVARRLSPSGWPKATIASSVAAAVLLVPATFARNEVWADDVTLWADAASKAPRNERAFGNLGFALARKGDRVRARRAYEAALSLDDSYYVGHTSLGALLLDEGQVEAALVHLKRAVVLRSDDPLAQFNLARGLQASGDADEAAVHYLAAIRAKHGRYPAAENNLAVVYAGQGRLELAVQHFRNAVALDPRDAMTHTNLGRALASSGDFDGAIAEFEAALRIQPRDRAAAAGIAAISKKRATAASHRP